MMRLGEIHRHSLTVDGSRRSPVADLAAAAWGYPAGAARFRRSSASHVFAVGDSFYLRLIPATHRSRAAVVAVADLVCTLAGRELPVAPPVPSRSGALVETVATPLGGMHATLVTAAPGRQIDVEELDPLRAAAWGAALARLHRDGGDAGDSLPGPFPELASVSALFPDDPAFVSAAQTLARQLDTLPRDAASFGTVHGDFELDNLGWAGGTPVAYDFDEAARSWYVADIAYAVRDLAGGKLLDTFLDGYRGVRPVPDLAHLPLVTGAHAVCSAVRVRRALDEERPGEPAWLVELRGKLERYVSRQRRAAIDAATGSPPPAGDT
jgi:Ser/Thr protein kinase RdoA (MazF antagonist)